jgi:hypothetical protein
MARTTPPQPTPAEREAARKQNESLRKARVSSAEARVIGSANRSEGSGAAKKYAAAGIVKKLPTAKQMGNMGMAKGAKVKAADKAGRALVKKSADTMGRAMVKKAGGGKCYAKGGAIDGVAKKGKTKGKMVAMKKGGKC